MLDFVVVWILVQSLTDATLHEPHDGNDDDDDDDGDDVLCDSMRLALWLVHCRWFR